jgi:hypothetical protein
MWIMAYTINHGGNDLRDYFTVYETEQEARDAFAMLVANDDTVHCACVAPIADATEPHWSEGSAA